MLVLTYMTVSGTPKRSQSQRLKKSFPTLVNNSDELRRFHNGEWIITQPPRHLIEIGINLSTPA